MTLVHQPPDLCDYWAWRGATCPAGPSTSG